MKPITQLPASAHLFESMNAVAAKDLADRQLAVPSQVDADGAVRITRGEDKLVVQDFALVEHYTFNEVQARVIGVVGGHAVDGTYVQGQTKRRQIREYYGVGDGGDGKAVLALLATSADVDRLAKQVLAGQ